MKAVNKLKKRPRWGWNLCWLAKDIPGWKKWYFGGIFVDWTTNNWFNPSIWRWSNYYSKNSLDLKNARNRRLSGALKSNMLLKISDVSRMQRPRANNSTVRSRISFDQWLLRKFIFGECHIRGIQTMQNWTESVVIANGVCFNIFLLQ